MLWWAIPFAELKNGVLINNRTIAADDQADFFDRIRITCQALTLRRKGN
jgi:hypothetical protein